MNYFQIDRILGYIALSYLLFATPYVIRILAMWWKEKRAERKREEGWRDHNDFA